MAENQANRVFNTSLSSRYLRENHRRAKSVVAIALETLVYHRTRPSRGRRRIADRKQGGSYLKRGKPPKTASIGDGEPLECTLGNHKGFSQFTGRP